MDILSGALPLMVDVRQTGGSPRRKLLDLYYQDKISAEAFAEEERRMADQIEAVRTEAVEDASQRAVRDDLALRFDQVVESLRNLDMSEVWAEATDDERRVLIEELVGGVSIFPDHLEVTISGAPALNVTLEEVGLKQSSVGGVGGGT
jgi:hypothetical protein